MKYIYLDQNQWIFIGQAMNGKNDKYIDVVKKIKEKVFSGEWAFPISQIHFIETTMHSDEKRRNQLSKIIGEFSKGYSLMSYPYYSVFELCFLLDNKDQTFNKTFIRDYIIKKDFMNYSGESFLNKSKSIMDENSLDLINLIDSGDLYKVLVDEYHKRYKHTLNDYSKDFLDYYNNLKFQLSTLCKSKDTKNLLKISLFEFYKPHHLDDYYDKELLKEVENNTLLSFINNIPSLNVNIDLTYSFFTNNKPSIHKNDFKDIMFLSSAIPYCDVVITETKWANEAKKRFKLDKKYSTVIEHDLNCLLNT